MPESASNADSQPIQAQEEPRPYKWAELTEEQKSAARRAMGLLKSMVEAGEAGPKPTASSGPEALDSIFPPIPENKRNNIILIEGSRGSGKTSLLVTILWWLRNAFREKRVQGEPPADVLAVPGGVLPVAVLELNPLPDSTHLLLYLVGRLERVVRALENPTAPRWRGLEEPPWKSSGSPPPPSRDRWNELSQAVVAWDGNLAKRAASLDPDAYAWEARRAEMYRREISESFQQFVDALCADVAQSPELGGCFKNDKGPFFLITLDDADLAPGRTIEVLDLLRKLWHPRLAFVLTGNQDLFLTVLRNDFLGTLLKPLASLDLPDNSWEIQSEMTSAVRLAGSKLEKVIPPTHRCHIRKLSSEDKLKRLEDALKQFTLNPEPGLQPEPPKNDLLSYFQEEIVATEALPDQLRPMLSLKEELRSFACEKKPEEPFHHREAARALCSLWRNLLAREPLLSSERELLKAGIALDGEDMLVVDRSVMMCQYTGRTVWKGDAGGGWRFEVVTQHRLMVSSSTWEHLPESLTGLFVLATDLVASIPDFHFRYESPAPSGFEFSPVRVFWDEPDDRLPPNGFTWPLPDWESFYPFTSFSKEWDRLVRERISSNRLDIVDLAQSFLAIVLSIAGEKPESQTWEKLASAVVALAAKGNRSGQGRTYYDWVLRAGLLARPESGLPAEEALKWREALEKAAGDKWHGMQRALASQRREQVKARWQMEQEKPPNPSNIEALLKKLLRVSRGGANQAAKSDADTDVAPPPVP